MSDTVAACPECNSSQAYERATKTPPWRCKNCGAEFEEPVTRAGQRASSLETADTSLERIPAETPDTILADVEPGDKLQTDAYADWHAIEEIESRTRWRVPFAPDWIDVELVVGHNGLAPCQARHRLVATADGCVVVNPTDGEMREVSEIERIGDVSTTSRLHYLEGKRESGGEVENDDDPLDQYRAGVPL